MPNITHDSLLSLVPSGSAAVNDWTTTLSRSDDIKPDGRNNRVVDSHEAWWAMDVAARGAPNTYPGEAKAVGLLAKIAAPYQSNETVNNIARGEPVFDIAMPERVSISEIEAVNADYATVARRIAGTPPGQEDPAPTQLTFEEAKRASGDNTLTLTERSAASNILRQFFIERSTGVSSEPVQVTAFSADGVRITLERSVDDVRLEAARVSYRLNNRALEIEAPAGTMILAELTGGNANWKVSERVVTVPASGRVRIDTAGRGAWLAFVKPGAGGELPELMRRVRLMMPDKTYGETRL